ncbi:MAG: hypothetical protein QG632_764 [Candidatus Dependentiae bacterium]|nr:hypothetical protein [Candidatus Dependentiae bacterium]
MNSIVSLIATCTIGLGLTSVRCSDVESKHGDSPASVVDSTKSPLSDRQKAVLYGNLASSHNASLVQARKLMKKATKAKTSELSSKLMTDAIALCNKVLKKPFSGHNLIIRQKLEAHKKEARNLLDEISRHVSKHSDDTSLTFSAAEPFSTKK